mmetsp:Transcript_2116/g.6403  ORF Transcript_2116/g.6403 Transcript_2116/m.6403 type:complete len:420 (+) Transcript_2116:681-1940(+)
MLLLLVRPLRCAELLVLLVLPRELVLELPDHLHELALARAGILEHHLHLRERLFRGPPLHHGLPRRLLLPVGGGLVVRHGLLEDCNLVQGQLVLLVRVGKLGRRRARLRAGLRQLALEVRCVRITLDELLLQLHELISQRPNLAASAGDLPLELLGRLGRFPLGVLDLDVGVGNDRSEHGALVAEVVLQARVHLLDLRRLLPRSGQLVVEALLLRHDAVVLRRETLVAFMQLRNVRPQLGHLRIAAEVVCLHANFEALDPAQRRERAAAAAELFAEPPLVLELFAQRGDLLQEVGALRRDLRLAPSGVVLQVQPPVVLSLELNVRSAELPPQVLQLVPHAADGGLQARAVHAHPSATRAMRCAELAAADGLVVNSLGLPVAIERVLSVAIHVEAEELQRLQRAPPRGRVRPRVRRIRRR